MEERKKTQIRPGSFEVTEEGELIVRQISSESRRHTEAQSHCNLCLHCCYRATHGVNELWLGFSPVIVFCIIAAC